MKKIKWILLLPLLMGCVLDLRVKPEQVEDKRIMYAKEVSGEELQKGFIEVPSAVLNYRVNSGGFIILKSAELKPIMVTVPLPDFLKDADPSFNYCLTYYGWLRSGNPDEFGEAEMKVCDQAQRIVRSWFIGLLEWLRFVIWGDI